MLLDDVDRQDFIKTLAEACQKTNWQVHAYCLMPNHYHLVLETPEPNLVAGMAWLQSTYTIRLNHRHQLFGHVSSGRCQSQLEGELGDHHSGELHRASAEAKAERIIAAELQQQGWQEAEMLVRPKNDLIKLEMAARLRRETTLSTKANKRGAGDGGIPAQSLIGRALPAAPGHERSAANPGTGLLNPTR